MPARCSPPGRLRSLLDQQRSAPATSQENCLRIRSCFFEDLVCLSDACVTISLSIQEVVQHSINHLSLSIQISIGRRSIRIFFGSNGVDRRGGNHQPHRAADPAAGLHHHDPISILQCASFFDRNCNFFFGRVFKLSKSVKRPFF
jgi:hypothetical protein